MNDWKAELQALRAQTDAMSAPVPVRESIASAQLRPIDRGGSERDEIRKRVENFRAHQRRFAREREEFATSLIASMRRAER